MYDKIVITTQSSGRKSLGFKKTYSIIFIVLLVAIPLVIYFLSFATTPKDPLEVSIFAEPERITVLDETKGITKDNYLVIGIRYRNNTVQSFENLRFYLPKYSVQSREAGVSGLVTKQVPLDFNSMRKNGGEYFVFVIPDIVPDQTRKVNIVSFFSKKPGPRQIQGEIRTTDGQKVIAKPVRIIIN